MGFSGVVTSQHVVAGNAGKDPQREKICSHLVMSYNAVRVFSNAQQIPCSGGIGMEGHAFWDSNQSA